jgi:hypothetical protein
MFLATNEHEYSFRSDKLFGCHFLASIREYSCSFAAKILSRAGQRPQTTKSVSTRKIKRTHATPRRGGHSPPNRLGYGLGRGMPAPTWV